MEQLVAAVEKVQGKVAVDNDVRQAVEEVAEANFDDTDLSDFEDMDLRSRVLYGMLETCWNLLTVEQKAFVMSEAPKTIINEAIEEIEESEE